MGKAPQAVATVIDSQSVRAAETVGRDSRAYDPAKKVNGRKRHLIVDTRGLPLLVIVTPADMTDRDAAKEVLFRLRLMHPEITIVWADSAYAGQLVTWAKTFLGLTIKTVSRPKDARRRRTACTAPPAAGSSTPNPTAVACAVSCVAPDGDLRRLANRGPKPELTRMGKPERKEGPHNGRS